MTVISWLSVVMMGAGREPCRSGVLARRYLSEERRHRAVCPTEGFSMPTRDMNIWMWSEACATLVRAERQYSQFFRLHRSTTSVPAWEPPVDVLETESDVLVLVALPGVDQDKVQAAIEDGDLIIVGHRVLPPELRTAVIHRLELPQGRFERRVPLPPGRYSAVQHTITNGCLVVALTKAA